jgi:hypothetical protein
MVAIVRTIIPRTIIASWLCFNEYNKHVKKRSRRSRVGFEALATGGVVADGSDIAAKSNPWSILIANDAARQGRKLLKQSHFCPHLATLSYKVF